MDWQAISALCILATVLGTIGGWMGKHLYDSGGRDTAIRNADLVAAASIGRLEIAVHELTGIVNQHLVDDARNFGELRTLVVATNGAMNSAATAVVELTRRIDQAIVARK